MAIVSTDIKFYLAGGASNSDPNASLGGAISSTEITTATVNNLFDRVTGAESSAGDTEYRSFYVKNTHGILTLQSAVIWIVSNTPSTDTTIDIGLAAEGANATLATIGNESTAPTSVSFSAPSSAGTGLSLGDLAAGQRYGIWVRRTVNASASAYADDNVVLRVQGDTAS